MFLAEFTVDLGQVINMLKYAAVAVLLFIAFFSFVLPLLRSIVVPGVSALSPSIKPETVLKRRNVDRSSDAPPPAGFSDHLRIIETAAPNATPQIWWEYAKAELTEAEVALAEAKIARIPTPTPVTV